MGARLRGFFDIRSGEALPVALTFLYIAVVVAAFLLAKPIRNALFLRQYGPYALAYVYAAVPLALSVFVPIYTRVAARFGQRAVTVWTLVFFASNVLLFWWVFRTHSFPLLVGVFYVWVNCFGIIAPVQAWSFANSQFDTRQAKRLFGLIGAGASFGAILGGLLARVLVRRVGGAINLLLVLAALILVAAVVVAIANARIKRRGLARRGKPHRHAFGETLQEIRRTPYLRLIAAMVFLVAIATQWTGFQLSVVADRRFSGNAEALTRFFGTFNFILGTVSLMVQLTLTSSVLRRYGVAVAILLLPVALGFGTASILLLPAFWPVIVTNALDQGLRFSVDKATYELLYLPIAPGARARIKNAVDIVLNRAGDATGGVLLGLTTRGFAGLPGLDVGIRGTAAINLFLLAGWFAIAWRLRREYVRTIHESIHRHRLDAERHSRQVLDRTAASALEEKLAADDPGAVRYALSIIEQEPAAPWRRPLHRLLHHDDPEIRRRALSILSASGDDTISPVVAEMLRDPDLAVRTEALLFLSRQVGIDPVARIQELGEFPDFSIRAGIAAFLASPGPARNLDAARVILEQMVAASGEAGARDRDEAARVLSLLPDVFPDLLVRLLEDENPRIARVAVQALSRAGAAGVPLLQERLLEEDPSLRYRVIAALNKLRRLHPEVQLDRKLIELLLAAEIAGHYRSHQVLGAVGETLAVADPVMVAMRQSMEHELERIFRLMSLLFPEAELQDAYVGLRSSNPIIRANALEFLDNVLDPQLRQLVVPVLDPQTSLRERIAIADRLVGAPVTTAEGGITALMADPRLRELAGEALRRISSQTEAEPPVEEAEPAPADIGIGV
jgi:ATP/ADP translocase/HEAT repeat protein